MDIMVQGIHLQQNRHEKRNIVKRHYHKVHQILYVLENEGELNFDNQQHNFSEDNLLFIPPYAQHSIRSNGSMTVLALEFSLDKLDPNIKELLHQYAFDQTKLLKLNVWEASDVRKVLRRMLYEQSQGKAINSVAMTVYLSELLLILLRYKSNSKFTDANSLRAERIKKYIDTRYFEIIDNEDISKKMKISTRYVNAIFKDHFNMTPMTYLNQVRIAEAKILLTKSNEDIAAICFEIGYEAISTFYRRFKNETGLSPNRYRLKQKGNIT